MNPSTENRSGIIEAIDRARKIDNEIGYYEEHFIHENGYYLVRLSNGRINVPTSLASDMEVQPKGVEKDRIK